MQLASLLDARTITVERRVLNKEQVYQNLVELICHHYKLPYCGSKLLERIYQREHEAPTSYPTGIAIPHVRMDDFSDTVIGMTFLQNPIEINGIMVSLVVLIITDKSSSKLYLNMVAALLGISSNPEQMAQLHNQADGHGILHLFKKLNIDVKMEISVADIMVKEPVSVNPEALLSEFSALISENDISMIPVTDAAGKYLGEVSILRFLKVGVPDYLMMIGNLQFLKSYEPLENLFQRLDVTKVREIMATDAKVLIPEASVVEAVFEMINNNKRVLSVVKDGRLVGVISAMDIFRKIIQS